MSDRASAEVPPRLRNTITCFAADNQLSLCGVLKMPNEDTLDQPDQTRVAPTFNLVETIVRMLEPLSRDDQRHVLQTVTTWLRLTEHPEKPTYHENSPGSPPLNRLVASNDDYPFSGRADVSAKEFLLEKAPTTDIERIACLAYYLTHYRDQPHFKTEDLSKLNTEAAQRRFSNAPFTAKNAFRDGFLVPAPKKGYRQLSALGEQYVQALPDHEAARSLRKRMSGRRFSSTRARKVAWEPTPPADE